MKPEPQPRPKLKLPLTKLEIGLEILTLPLVLLNLALPIMFWTKLPGVVPSHFDAQGVPNGFSSRGVVWVLAFFALGSYLAMTVMARFPHTFNYIWPISEKNAAKQYVLARKFVAVLKMETNLLLFFVAWNIISVGTRAADKANVGDFFTLVAMLIISCVVYMGGAYAQK